MFMNGMRRFYLRTTDGSLKRVADGIVFKGGHTVLRWRHRDFFRPFTETFEEFQHLLEAHTANPDPKFEAYLPSGGKVEYPQMGTPYVVVMLDPDKRSKNLRYAARDRCKCGAGFAYLEDARPGEEIEPGLGEMSWVCSAVLRALLAGKQPEINTPESHSAPLDFAFYEVKSERQPSSNGETTRPEDDPRIPDDPDDPSY